MQNYDTPRKNCLQWGFQVIHPQIYLAVLARYAVNITPDALTRISKAHYSRSRRWYWQWLPCEVREEGMWMNIATAHRILERREERLATFPSWEDYEDFRENIRELTDWHFRKDGFF